MMPDARAQHDPQSWNMAYAEGFAAGLEEARRRIALRTDELPPNSGARIGMWEAWRIVFKQRVR